MKEDKRGYPLEEEFKSFIINYLREEFPYTNFNDPGAFNDPKIYTARKSFIDGIKIGYWLKTRDSS